MRHNLLLILPIQWIQAAAATATAVVWIVFEAFLLFPILYRVQSCYSTIVCFDSNDAMLFNMMRFQFNWKLISRNSVKLVLPSQRILCICETIFAPSKYTMGTVAWQWIALRIKTIIRILHAIIAVKRCDWLRSLSWTNIRWRSIKPVTYMFSPESQSPYAWYL